MIFSAGGRLIKFYRKKIAEARQKLESGEEAADFVTCYLKEIESIENTDVKIKEDWTIQVIFFFNQDKPLTSLSLFYSSFW